MQITKEILAANGWEFDGHRMVLKTDVKGAFYCLKTRLTWHPDTKELTVNYGSVPTKVEYVHQLQQILDICGLEKYKLTIQ